MSLTELAFQHPLPSDWQQAYIDQLVSCGDILPIPASIVDRDGKAMATSTNRWMRNHGPSTMTYSWRIESPLLDYALKAFAINRIQRNSAHAGSAVASNIPAMMRKCAAYPDLVFALSLEVYRAALTRVMQQLADMLKRDQTFDRYWLPAAWYKWGAGRVADLGFDISFAQRLESIRIPGNPKGVAVRSGDPCKGPLDPELERSLLEVAIMADDSVERNHLQEKLAIAVGLAFGNNPFSFCSLTEDDFKVSKDSSGREVFSLDMPLIKKRSPPRSHMKSVHIGPFLAALIRQAIESNRDIDTDAFSSGIGHSGSDRKMLRPLFMRSKPSATILKSADCDFAFSLRSADFNNLLKRFVRRHRIVSPVTGRLLHLSPRRMRYTFGTDMVDMGLSKRQLATLLGHTDIQHVGVYFDIGRRIVPHLEKAAAGRIDPLIAMFTPGDLAPEDPLSDSAEGKQRLVPPFTCYLCAAFRPCREANHAGMLELMSFQNADHGSEKYESAREIQATVAQMIHVFAKGEKHDD